MNKLRGAIQLALGTTMSNREIGREIEIAFNTVRRYRQVANEKGYELEHLMALDDDALHRAFNKGPQRWRRKRVPDWNHIRSEMQRRHVTLQLLWEEYCKEDPDPDTSYMYSQFTELYREWSKRNGLSMRQQHAPGERGWADFLGPTIPWVDANTGEVHHAQVFVGALGCSHLLFAYAVPSQKSECWIEAHNRWYEFLGGVPAVTVIDNLKAGVTRAGRDVVFNPTYLELARHYGTVLLAARSRKPKDKAKAEGGVLIIERWALARLRNRTFHSIAEINTALAECLELINNREMRVHKESRREMFERVDKPKLLELPESPFEVGQWSPAICVPNDYHILVDHSRYSVPYRLVGEEVTARLTASVVEIFHRRERIASHTRSNVAGTIKTEPAHQPESHRAWSSHNAESYRQWAISIGTYAPLVIEHQFATARHSALALKACSDLKLMAKTFGAERFEAACCEALRIKSPTRKSIRSLLQNRLEHRRRRNSDGSGKIPPHDNVRGADYFGGEDASHAG